MKLNARKTYCRKCQRLVTAKEQPAAGNTQLLCPRCGETLWTWNGLRWHHIQKAP
jgi:predicted RNA-binding Zn-ribbon protein involved in translation (DUF1610 family)